MLCLRLVESVSFGRHDEIVTVQVPYFVGPPSDRYPPPFRDQPRMVSFFFGQPSDGVGKRERLRKVRKAKHPLKLPDSFLRDEFPFGYLGMELRNFLIRHTRRIGSTGNAPLPSQGSHNQVFDPNNL